MYNSSWQSKPNCLILQMAICYAQWTTGKVMLIANIAVIVRHYAALLAYYFYLMHTFLQGEIYI